MLWPCYQIPSNLAWSFSPTEIDAPRKHYLKHEHGHKIDWETGEDCFNKTFFLQMIAISSSMAVIYSVSLVLSHVCGVAAKTSTLKIWYLR
jgi:hypothetical protein